MHAQFVVVVRTIEFSARNVVTDAPAKLELDQCDLAVLAIELLR